MAFFETSRPLGVGRDTTRSSGFLSQLTALFADWNDGRKTRIALNRLNDRELDDLGLTRADIDRLTGDVFR